MTNRIDQMFKTKREQNRKSLILFLTAGYPNLDFTKEILPKLPEWGCDLIELGIPFSDPIADGPTIQAAGAAALEQGTTVKKILGILPEIREKTNTPIILFTALNPLLKYGLEQIVLDAKAAGADGFLVADLLPEEGEELTRLCAEHDMSLIFLVAPTSGRERKKLIAEKSSGFIYYISVRGVTGARAQLAEDLDQQIAELREFTDKPIAVGFGISKPEHVRKVAAAADGVVVGSALINTIRDSWENGNALAEAEKFVRSLANALP